MFHIVRVSATSQKSGLLFLSLFFVFQMSVVIFKVHGLMVTVSSSSAPSRRSQKVHTSGPDQGSESRAKARSLV